MIGYTIDDPNSGTLSLISSGPWHTSGPGGYPDVDESGRFLYVAGGPDGFQIDQSTGALTPTPGSPYNVSGSTGVVVVH